MGHLNINLMKNKFETLTKIIDKIFHEFLVNKTITKTTKKTAKPLNIYFVNIAKTL